MQTEHKQVWFTSVAALVKGSEESSQRSPSVLPGHAEGVATGLVLPTGLQLV